MVTLVCPACRSEVSLAPRRLLVRVDVGAASRGEVLFTCLSCHHSVSVDLDAAGVASLVTVGVTHLSVSAPLVEHPEVRPAGPAFTADDVLDLHAELADDRWLDALATPSGEPDA